MSVGNEVAISHVKTVYLTFASSKPQHGLIWAEFDSAKCERKCEMSQCESKCERLIDFALSLIKQPTVSSQNHNIPLHTNVNMT